MLGKPDHRVIEFTQAQTLFCGTVLISKARRVMYLVPEVEAILGKPDHRVIEFTQAHPPTQQTANSK
jgi:hypothetical protein